MRCSSANIDMIGDASADDILNIASHLEDLRTAIQTILPNFSLSPRVPTTAVVFRDFGSFTPFVPLDAEGRRRQHVGGYFVAAADANHLVLPIYTDRSETLRVAFHEYVHLVLHDNQRVLPRWLNEGAAQFFDSFTVDAKTRQAVIGLARAEPLGHFVRGPLVALDQLLDDRAAETILNDARRAPVFYAQSWALFHYLQIGHGGARSGQLVAYLRALDAGDDQDRAFAGAFGADYAVLDRELRQYATRSKFPAIHVRLPDTAPRKPASVARMTEVEVLGWHADLLARAGSHRDAERKAERALAADAAQPEARLGLALVRLAQLRHQEAVAILDSLATSSGPRFAAEYYRSLALTHLTRHDEALAAAERAVALNSQSAAAWFQLSVAALAVGHEEQSQEGISRAMALLNWPDWHRQRAHHAFVFGRDAVAVQSVDVFLARRGWRDAHAPYAAFLSASASRRMGRSEAADRILEQVRQHAGLSAGSWTAAVLDFMQGRLAAAELLGRARSDGELTEAHAYIGLEASFAGRREEAREHLRWVKDKGSRNYTEYPLAIAELARLERTDAPRD